MAKFYTQRFSISDLQTVSRTGVHSHLAIDRSGHLQYEGVPRYKGESEEVKIIIRKYFTISHLTSSSVRSTRAEMTLAKVVLSIVVTFLACHVPRIYLQSYRVRDIGTLAR